MSLTFILGRAGSGKTMYCLDAIRQRLLDQPEGPPLILLVPEQATFQAEKAIVTSPGINGIIRAQVLSFRRLAYRVLQETGGIVQQPIDEAGKTLLLYKIVRERMKQLTQLEGTLDQIGFVDELRSLFDELARYQISPDELQQHWKHLEKNAQASPLFTNKLHDVQLIFHAYEQALQSGYTDGEAMLERFSQQAEQSHYLQSAEIWIDGFNGFTPSERSGLAALMKTAVNVHMTLTVDRPYAAGEVPNELDLFYPTGKTMGELRQIAQELDIKEEKPVILPGPETVRFKHNPELAHLEKHFTDRKIFPSQLPSNNLMIRSAAHLRAEAAGMAREMIRLVREEGYRWRDFAVLLRSPEVYHDLLRTTLTDYGIPYFFDQKRTVLDHPLVELIRSALEVVKNHWRYDDVFRCVKTDFFLPIATDQVGTGGAAVVRTATAETATATPVGQSESASSEEATAETATATPVGQSESASSEEATAETAATTPVRQSESESADATGSTTAPLTPQQRWKKRMDQLENYVLAYGVQGSRWKSEHTWKLRGHVSLDDDPEAEERITKAAEYNHRQILLAKERVVTPLEAFEQRMKAAKDVRSYITALFTLLEDVQARERLEVWGESYIAQGAPEKAREHVQIWDRIMDMFDQMVEICGDDSLTLDMFSGLIEAGLSSIRMALVPPALDQVLIGSMDRTRSGNVRCCFILGANDGMLPQTANESGIFTELEREKLDRAGLELAPSSRRQLLDEQFLIYSALTTATDKLWISYPIADEEGKTLLPSEIVRRLQRMYPHWKETFLPGEPPYTESAAVQLEWIARPLQTLADLVNQLRLWKEGTAIDPIWWDVYDWFANDDRWRDLLDRMVYGLFFTNKEAKLSAETSEALYGDVLQASVSRMELFVSCPFAQFASYGLKLRERPIYRLEAPDIGQLFHAALKMIAVDLQQNKLSWARLSTEECQQKAGEVVDQLAPRLQHEILLSSKRFRYIARKLKQIVGRAAAVLAEHERRGAFVPVGLEVEFGKDAEVPPLEFALNNGRKMEIRGRIDRVDQAQGENGVYLRVIDYKSSATSLQLAEVFYGLSLQMLTYLDVVITHAKRWLGEAATPAGVLYFHVHNPMLNTPNRIPVEQAEQSLFKRFKMRGWVLEDPDAVSMMDQTLEKGHSDIIPVGLKTDGSFFKNSSVVSETGWEEVRAFTRRKIQQIGTELTNGEVEVAPYRLNKKTPCQFCSFRPVCQFDSSFADNDYRDLSKQTEDELWRNIEQSLHEEGEHEA